MTGAAPWSVLWFRFDPQVGTEQSGTRPAIVVGTTFASTLRNGLVIVVPCTTRDRQLPWHVPVTFGERAGFAMCDQVKAVSVTRVQRRHQVGTLTDQPTRDRIAFVLGRLLVC